MTKKRATPEELAKEVLMDYIFGTFSKLIEGKIDFPPEEIQAVTLLISRYEAGEDVTQELLALKEKMEQAEKNQQNDSQQIADSFYSIIIHDDDKTALSFVIYALERVFKIGEREAYAIVDRIEEKGKSVVANYTNKEEANAMMQQALSLAQKNDYPLQFTVQENFLSSEPEKKTSKNKM